MSFQQKVILSTVQKQLNAYEGELIHISILPVFKMSVSSNEFADTITRKSIISQIKKNDEPNVYNISCVNLAERRQLIAGYVHFQKTNSVRVRGKDRLNISRFNHSESETLYLGSTMGDISGRINQHLGGGNFRTYSLHLSKWAIGLNYKISLSTYVIRHNQNKILERPFVELIEQALWDHYKPVFGKKSGL